MAVSQLSTARGLESRLDPLMRIGRTSAGTTRLAWSAEQQASESWFREQAQGLGLRVEVDSAGNLWARPNEDPPWWAIGSHLDTVERGGSFDGALGVAAAFEVVARTSARLAVISFADEEGARFNTPTFGSRALTGDLNLPDVLARSDRDGITLAEAMTQFGVDPSALDAAQDWLPRLHGFVEIHVDQTTELAETHQPIGLITAAVARLRLEVVLGGQADHAGATAIGKRRDALAAAARLIVASEEAAAAEPAMVATATRMEIDPNQLTTVARGVRLWLDARAPEQASIHRWLSGIREQLVLIERRLGVSTDHWVRSHSHRIEMDQRLVARLEAIARRRELDPPRMLSFAGHDACVLARRLPTAMVMVRNESGISHAPEEASRNADAADAIELVAALAEQDWR